MGNERKKIGYDENVIYISPEDIEIMDKDYSSNIDDEFKKLPSVARPLVSNAKKTFSNIKKMLYTLPSLLETINAHVPEEFLHAVFTDEQKKKLADGTLKLMTKKDGSLMANLVNPETNKIVATVPLKSIKLTPELAKAMTNYSTQMQMADIAEQIETVKIAIEEVRQGQESDRLAEAYSCQQKLLQAMQMKSERLQEMALLQIASDAENSRQKLMLTQKVNLAFITNQPNSFWGKLMSGDDSGKISKRMDEIRESLIAVNMVSLVEAMAYQEMGETEAAKQSLLMYADFIKKVYLEAEGLVDRLDMIDQAPTNYWTKAIPQIQEKIMALPGMSKLMLEG